MGKIITVDNNTDFTVAGVVQNFPYNTNIKFNCWIGLEHMLNWYGEDYYAVSPANDPLGPPPPKSTNPWDFNRVRRGGSWREDAINIRASVRSFDGVSYPGDNGFRLVRSA